VLYLWGIPRFVSVAGLNMDADYLMNVVKAKDGNGESAKQFMLISGITSSILEHSVPEQLFSTPETTTEGISAVKALKIANEQGIPIYTVTQANITTILPQLQVGQEVKADIQNVVNAGKIVTVSKTNISFNGWIGCGYIITNPETGAGAYMISGGQNGGWYVLWWIGYIILLTLRAAGMIAIAALAAIVLGPFLFALEEIIVSVAIVSARYIANCFKKMHPEAPRQIIELFTKRLNAPDPFTMITQVIIQLTKIWALTCGQPG